VSFFLKGSLAQEFFFVFVRPEPGRALRFVAFLIAVFGCFHAANCDICARRAIPPAIQVPPPIILQDR
jgi:hypothetical protein